MKDREKFLQEMKAMRVEEVPEYDGKKELKKYEKFVNSSYFDDLRNVEVSPYCGDTER